MRQIDGEEETCGTREVCVVTIKGVTTVQSGSECVGQKSAEVIVVKTLSSRKKCQRIKPSLEEIKVYYARGWLNYYRIASMK